MSSIYHIKEKIKGFQYMDKRLLFYVLIIIFVAVGSFILGRISSSTVLGNDKVVIVNNREGDLKEAQYYASEASQPEARSQNIASGKYVASKNGKLYYRIGCGASSRIKEENQVFFNSTQEAEESGFEPSASCTP